MKKKPRIVTLNIDQIVCDAELKVRVEIDEATVDDYFNVMETEDDVKKFPKPTVYFDGWRYLLVDGYHRYLAVLRRQYKTMTVEVIDGTKDEAILAAVRLNMNHGLRFKDGDWEKIITMISTKEQWKNWTNRRLAEVLNCGETTIRRYRPEHSVAPGGATEKRQGKDGKMYKTKKDKKPETGATESPQSEETVTEPRSTSAVASTTVPEVIETSPPESEAIVSVASVITADTPEADEESASDKDRHLIDLNIKQTQIDDTISLLETQLIEWLELVSPDEGGDFKKEISSRLHALANDL